MTDPLDIAGWSCPLPLRNTPNVVLGHGGGGVLTSELIGSLFLPAYGDAAGTELGDAAVLPPVSGRLALSTDSFVVKPMFFPGGSIGELAVNGTINDLAMAGAHPLYLATAYVIAEGTSMADLGRIAEAVGAAARAAGVALVTGDTKVVDHGSGDGVYVTTTGLGIVPDGLELGPARLRDGDVVVVSGDIGVHGVAILSCREGLEFETTIESDTAALHTLVAAMLATGADVKVMRDPTRGGLAATLTELSSAGGVGVVVDEAAVPVPAQVRDACGILGLDPFHVANEGKLVAVVASADAPDLVAAMRAHPLGRGACVIGRVVADHPGVVVARTPLGGTRVVDPPLGEQLPRIC